MNFNLKLSIIACLNERGLYFEAAELIKNELYGTLAFNNLDYDAIIPEIKRYYQKLELEQNHLDSIIEFNPSASNKCYNLLVKEWNGEDDIFDLKSLSGIEMLSNLKVFNPFGLLHQDIDLSALLLCQNLKFVHTEFIPENCYTNEILEKLKSIGIELI